MPLLVFFVVSSVMSTVYIVSVNRLFVLLVPCMLIVAGMLLRIPVLTMVFNTVVLVISVVAVAVVVVVIAIVLFLIAGS